MSSKRDFLSENLHRNDSYLYFSKLTRWKNQVDKDRDFWYLNLIWFREVKGLRYLSGWQILDEVAQKILDTQLEEVSDQERNRMEGELATQCAARIKEFLPRDRKEAIVQKVMSAACKFGDLWDPSITSFVISQIGWKGLQKFLQAHPGWTAGILVFGERSQIVVGEAALLGEIAEPIEDFSAPEPRLFPLVEEESAQNNFLR